MNRKQVGLVGAAMVAFLACQSGADSARGVAERFLDEHYVHIRVAAAKSYAVGPALLKLEEEQRLVGDQVIDESTDKPHVSYSLKETREEGAERTMFVFDAEIRSEGLDPFHRRWIVSTRRQPDGAWKVSNYEEVAAVE